MSAPASSKQQEVSLSMALDMMLALTMGLIMLPVSVNHSFAFLSTKIKKRYVW